MSYSPPEGDAGTGGDQTGGASGGMPGDQSTGEGLR